MFFEGVIQLGIFTETLQNVNKIHKTGGNRYNVLYNEGMRRHI